MTGAPVVLYTKPDNYNTPESIATLSPFVPTEEHKWFFPDFQKIQYFYEVLWSDISALLWALMFCMYKILHSDRRRFWPSFLANWKQNNGTPMTVNLHKGPIPRKGKQHCVSDVSVFEGRRGWFQDKCRWHFSLLTQFLRKQKKPGPLLLVYFMCDTFYQKQHGEAKESVQWK